MTAPVALVSRREIPDDIPVIHAVEVAAFRQTNEATLVDSLRNAGALTFSAVAALEGKIVAHIAYSPITIESGQECFSALALAPMAVHPESQRKGIGSALIKWSLNECRRDGHELVIVLGHPEYYPRFDFFPAMPLGIQCPLEVPSEAFMLLELQPGAIKGRNGTVRYRPEFAEV